MVERRDPFGGFNHNKVGGLEQNASAIQEQIRKMNGKDVSKTATGTYLYEDALDYVLSRLKEALEAEIKQITQQKQETNQTFTKQDLRDRKSKYRIRIEKIMDEVRFKVAGYDDMDKFIDDVNEEIVGYSILSNAFNDPGVSDIYVIAWNNIFVERNGVNEKYEKTFRSRKHYHNFVERVLKLTGKQVNNGDRKIVDAEYYEDRIAVTGEAVSPIDMTLTIRKHQEDHITLDQIVRGGTMSQEVANLLGIMIAGETNIIYAGITGSGKTTTLRALLDYYVPKLNKRMIIAEDTQELYPKNEHTLQLVTSPAENPKHSVSLRDLIITTLRLKPKYIVVGEVRGPEAEAAVEAMETGHSTLFSMHGGTPWNIINRLVNKYLMQMPSLSVDVVERIIANSVDYIAIQDDIPHLGRRVSTIVEVTFDYEKSRVRLVPIMKYDFETNEFVMLNKLSPEKGDKMMRRGVDLKTIREITRASETDYCESLEDFKAGKLK